MKCVKYVNLDLTSNAIDILLWLWITWYGILCQLSHAMYCIILTLIEFYIGYYLIKLAKSHD